METYCRKRRQQLAVERTKVDTLAREAFAGALFGPEHPYGIAYPESAYDTLERRSLTDHYRRLYTGGNAIAVCSGHVGEEELKAIVELAEQLPEGSAPSFAFPSPRAVRSSTSNAPKPCNPRCASDGCSSPATTPISRGCRSSPPCWAATSAHG